LTKQLDNANKHIQLLSNITKNTVESIQGTNQDNNQNDNEKTKCDELPLKKEIIKDKFKKLSNSMCSNMKSEDLNLEDSDSFSEKEQNILLDKLDEKENLKDELISKARDLNSLSKNIENDKDNIIQRLIKSVNMVKEVLQSNLRLRIQNQEQSKEINMLKAEKFHLYNENDELKEKEKLIMEMGDEDTTKNDIKNITKLKIANEIVQLKKEKSELEQRVKNLEKENIHFRAHPESVYLGNCDFEPVRSIVNTAEVNNYYYNPIFSDPNGYKLLLENPQNNNNYCNRKDADLNSKNPQLNEIIFRGKLKKMKKDFDTNVSQNASENRSFSKNNYNKSKEFYKYNEGNKNNISIRKTIKMRKEKVKTAENIQTNIQFFDQDKNKMQYALKTNIPNKQRHALPSLTNIKQSYQNNPFNPERSFSSKQNSIH